MRDWLTIFLAHIRCKWYMLVDAQSDEGSVLRYHPPRRRPVLIAAIREDNCITALFYPDEMPREFYPDYPNYAQLLEGPDSQDGAR